MSVVLVHGIYTDATIWDHCRPIIDAELFAVDLPGRPRNPAVGAELKIDSYVKAIVALLDSKGIESATVIGHSFAGAVLCALARTVPHRVANLVFVSAVIPEEGRRPVDDLQPVFATFVREQATLGSMLEVLDAMIPLACNDMDETQTAFLRDHLVPEPIGPLMEMSGPLRIPSNCQCVYLKTLRDEILTPVMQDGFITRLGSCEVINIDAGHFPMISCPRELETILQNYLADI